MTRGTLILLRPKKALVSVEFNGDMYGAPKDEHKGHYSEVVERLTRVEGEPDFINEVYDFDEKFFDYQSETEDLVEEIDWEKKWTLNDPLHIYFDLPYNLQKRVRIDNLEIDYFKHFFSDYLYFKNMTGLTIVFNKRYPDENKELKTFVSNKVKDNEIATFYFGDHIETIRPDGSRRKDVKINLGTPKSKTKNKTLNN